MYFSPTSTNSKLSIHYHSTNVDSLSLDFSLSGDAARVNFFEKDTSYFNTSINTYVQSMAGYKTVIETQHLDTLKSFFNNVEKQAKVYRIDGAYHEIHHEIERYRKPYFEILRECLLP